MSDEQGKAATLVGNEFKGILIHGPTKYEIKLRNISEATVQDLSDEAFNLTKVPVLRQRLICKGKSLNELGKTLQEYRVTNGSKILLLGKKHDPEEQSKIVCIVKIEKKVDQTEQEISEVKKEYESLKQGFLDAKQIEELTKRLKKRFQLSGKNLEEHIENLDIMELDSSFQEARLKKRNLIQRIQRLQSEVDAFTS